MAIVPSPKAMGAVSLIMAKTLQDLHKIIETECDHQRPKEAMVLMMAFATGTILQLKDKVETLEQGLGDQLLKSINAITKDNPAHREIIEKLNRNDPSLKKSASGIEPDDLTSAVNFISEKLSNTIHQHFSELPFMLRNENTLLHSLSVLVARLFNKIDGKNLEAYIKAFSENVRVAADREKQGSTFEQKYH